MRSIFAGIEYAGKSTLATMLGEYYRHRRVPIHGDDHFTLPDASAQSLGARGPSADVVLFHVTAWSACPMI